MDKSILKSFTYMFDANDRAFKISILVMLYLPIAYFSYVMMTIKANGATPQLNYGNIVIFFFIVWLTSLFATGYLAKCTQNIILFNGDQPFDMPNWEDNFIGYLVIGFKKGVSVFVTTLVLLPTVILLAIPLLIYSFIYPALDNIFCSEFKFNSYFSWKKAFSIIASNNKLYYSILGLLFLLSIARNLFYLLKLPAGLFIFLLAIFMAYLSLISAYWIGIINRGSDN